MKFANMIMELPSPKTPKYVKFENAKNQMKSQHKICEHNKDLASSKCPNILKNCEDGRK